MNELKSIKIAGILVLAGALTPTLIADTVVLTQGPFSFSNGGEFTATTVPEVALLSAYSPYTHTATTFQTFCVQDSTDFAPGNVYIYSLSSISLGSDGYPGHTTSPGNLNSYALSEGTAWLYSQFARGTLVGYDFSNGLSQRNTDAGLLQSAIWELQGGQSFAGSYGYVSGGLGNIYYDEALAALGGNLTTAATAATDYGVQIMVLSQYGGGDNGPGYYQNQLVLVPDGGSTVALLGIAISGLAMYRRRS